MKFEISKWACDDELRPTLITVPPNQLSKWGTAWSIHAEIKRMPKYVNILHINQVAPMYSAPMFLPMRAHWHHLANTIQLVLPSTNPSPQPKCQPICWAIFAPFAAVSSAMPRHVLSLNSYPFAWRSGPHLIIHGALCQPESSVQIVCQSLQPFCRSHYCVRPNQPTDWPRYTVCNYASTYAVWRCGIITAWTKINWQGKN